MEWDSDERGPAPRIHVRMSRRPRPGEPVPGVGDRALIRAEAVRAHEHAAGLGGIRIRRGVADGIQLMVAHDAMRVAGVAHGADRLQHPQLLGTSVDQIAQKNGHAAVWGCPNAVSVRIAQFTEQAFQFGVVAVDVADDVVHAVSLSSTAILAPAALTA